MPLAPRSPLPSAWQAALARAAWLGLLGLLGLSGCGHERPEADEPRASGRALGGDDTSLASSPRFPDAALARICQMIGPGPEPGAPDGCFVPGPPPPLSLTCSAALVGQNVLLTAGHCVCSSRSSWPRSVWFGASGYRVKGARAHPGALCHEPSSPSQAAHDLAVVWVDRPVEPFDASPLALSTGAALGEALRTGSLPPPLRAAGVGAVAPGAPSSPLGAARSGEIDRARLSLLPDGIILGQASPGATGFEGDSGGPLSASSGGEPLLLGVLSGHVDVSLEAIWAPAFDAEPPSPGLLPEQTPNGAFLRSALAELDADGDGLTDDLAP